MRISPHERDLIARVGLHGDASLRELARLSGHQLHTVRYALDRLRERGILKKLWVIDVLTLGWQRFEIFFATGCRTAATKNALTKYIASLPRISFLAEAGGDYDYEIIFLAKNSCEVSAFLEDLSKKFPDAILTRSVVIHQKVSYFPRKYLAEGKLPLEEIAIDSTAPITIDHTDQKILELLTYVPTVTKREIAQKLGVSSQTVDARIEKLSQRGAIRGALFSVDAGHFGGQNFIFLIHTRGVRKEIGEGLSALAKRNPHCTNFRKCFGPWDYEIGVEVLHHRELVQLKEEIFEKFKEAINSITVISRFKVHKYVQYPITQKELELSSLQN